MKGRSLLFYEMHPPNQYLLCCYNIHDKPWIYQDNASIMLTYNPFTTWPITLYFTFFWGHHPPFWSVVPTPPCPCSVSRPVLVSTALLSLWVPLQCHVTRPKRALILACCALSVQIKSRQLKPTLRAILDSSPCQPTTERQAAAASGKQLISSDDDQVGIFCLMLS